MVTRIIRFHQVIDPRAKRIVSQGKTRENRDKYLSRISYTPLMQAIKPITSGRFARTRSIGFHLPT
jgi:hypothetical protein